jgi:predicted alpha/beta superfamily hydrolase
LSFKLLVGDSIWSIGYNERVYLPGTTQKNNFLTDVYPFFYSNAGDYAYVRNVYSPQLKNTRDLVVYTPPSYYENTYKPIKHVLIMHDGQNLFNPSTCFAGKCWNAHKTINQFVFSGNIEEVAIVGINNTPDRINEYTCSYDQGTKGGGKGDLYLDFIEKTVLPVIQKNYRVLVKKENIGILGSSLGGLISCYAGWTHSSIYGKSGCMSSSFWWNNEDFNETILTTKSSPLPNLIVYVDSGDSGPSQDDMIQTITVEVIVNNIGALVFIFH